MRWGRQGAAWGRKLESAVRRHPSLSPPLQLQRSELLQQLNVFAGLSRWWLSYAPAASRALSLRGRQEGRGKATGSNVPSVDPEDGKQASLASLVFGSRITKPRGTRKQNRVVGNIRENEPPSPASTNHGAATRGQRIRGVSEPTHLKRLWERARERAHVNSNVKVDWLSAQKLARGVGKRKRALAHVKTRSAPIIQDGGGSVLEGQSQTLDARERSCGQSGKVSGVGTSEQVHTPKNGKVELSPLTKDFWNDLLLQRDPTKGLREVALRSLVYVDDSDGTGSRPVDPTLWWLEKMIRIKWGGLSYLPKNLRKDDEMDIPQREKGEKVLINHVIQVTAQAPCRLRVRWAALLHDVGKPDTVSNHEGQLTFHNHESEGARMVQDILRPYGYDDKFCKEVATLVLRSGRVRSVEKFNDQGARRLLATMGPLFDDLIDLYAADCTSSRAHKQAEHQARADLLAQHVQAVLDRDRIASLRSPLNGHDIMRATGLEPGYKLGRLVRALRQDYLRRGPYSTSEAYGVVQRLHAQLRSGDKVSGFQSKRGGLYPDGHQTSFRRKRRLAIDADSQKGGENWKPLHADPSGGEHGQEEVLVFRLRLDCHRWRVAAGSESAEAAPFEGGEVFRDVAVRRDTSLYTLAKVVTHAFDFDFDDDFAFYRRRRGLVCPGAEAAYSGIPVDARPVDYAHVHPKASHGVGGVSAAHLSTGTEESQALDEETLVGNDFELLARACGSKLRCMNVGGFAFRYDNQSERLKSGPGLEMSVAQWRPDDEHGSIPDDSTRLSASGVGPVSSVGAESLSYPLRLPQHGPASLIHTLVGNLFDRSRRSLVFALYNDGPRYVRVDFVEARERKHYEASLPCVTARMGNAPR